MKFAFKMDWEDADLYDVVLNTDKLSIDTAVPYPAVRPARLMFFITAL